MDVVHGFRSVEILRRGITAKRNIGIMRIGNMQLVLKVVLGKIEYSIDIIECHPRVDHTDLGAVQSAIFLDERRKRKLTAINEVGAAQRQIIAHQEDEKRHEHNAQNNEGDLYALAERLALLWFHDISIPHYGTLMVALRKKEYGDGEEVMKMEVVCSEAPPEETLAACISKLRGLFSIGRSRSPYERMLQAQTALKEAEDLLLRSQNHPELSKLRKELQTATDSAEEHLERFSKISR